MAQLNPRHVLILGASGGIGSALALDYAEPGRMLTLQGRDTARLAALGQDCEARGARVELRVIDLRHGDELRRWLTALGEGPAIDLAILNAGATNMAGAEGERWEDVENLMAVNLMATLAAVSSLVPAMRQRGRGQIALVSSLAAYFGMPITPAYGASKAALKNYGEALRGGLASAGIDVNVVLPGFVKTPMSDRFEGPKPFLMSPERAARIIRRGLAANRARIAFPVILDLGMRCLAMLPAAWSLRIMDWLDYGSRSRPIP